MIQLKFLAGNKAGTVWVARHFPVRIGRAATADVRPEDNGVWDEHIRLEFLPAEGVILKSQSEALTTVNQEPVREVILRNGDQIGVGSSKIQFWLSENRQAGLGLREGLTWAGIVLVSLGQVGLIYWLLH